MLPVVHILFEGFLCDCYLIEFSVRDICPLPLSMIKTSQFSKTLRLANTFNPIIIMFLLL